jgi:hypothetical protein
VHPIRVTVLMLLRKMYMPLPDVRCDLNTLSNSQLAPRVTLADNEYKIYVGILMDGFTPPGKMRAGADTITMVQTVMFSLRPRLR